MSLQLILLQLSEGMLSTIWIFVLTLLFSLPLGLVIAFGRMSRNVILRNITRIYISIMRGTPLMLQLLVVYFGPYYIFGISISSSYRAYAVIIAFALNYAAYFAEIYRSGIASMPKGQYEAAKVLGYSRTQTFFTIILPQVIKRILPSVTNEVITLVKDTSLAFSHCLCGNVYAGKGTGGIAKEHGAVCGCSRFLLHFQFCCGGDHGILREEDGILPIG